jgi:hypothetical protein
MANGAKLLKSSLNYEKLVKIKTVFYIPVWCSESHEIAERRKVSEISGSRKFC